MNKQLIFLIISSSVLILSAIVICVAPIMNNIEISYQSWKPSKLSSLNCKIFADEEKKETIELDKLQKMRKLKNLCYRQKAIYGLEFSSFILELVFSFICANLALLHYLKIGENFVKKTGFIGLITGIVGFIMTFVYVIYSGYIFTNDPAYGVLKIDSQNLYLNFEKPNDLIRLYPNGAKYKWDGKDKYITVYENDKGDFDKYIKYKDLGGKQYNYNTDYYKYYKEPSGLDLINNCYIKDTFEYTLGSGIIKDDDGKDCDYLYYPSKEKVENKYIYDRWLTTLILAVIICIFNIALAIFGFLLFKYNHEQKYDLETVPIISNK